MSDPKPKKPRHGRVTRAQIGALEDALQYCRRHFEVQALNPAKLDEHERAQHKALLSETASMASYCLERVGDLLSWAPGQRGRSWRYL